MSFKGRSANRVLLPFGLEHADVLSQGQETEGPTLELPVHGPLSSSEESAAKQALALAKLLYDGPFYTGAAEKSGSTPSVDSIERYSDRYKKVKKVTRSIDEYPYQLNYFPEELYLVMGLTNKKKRLLLSTYKTDGGLAPLEVQPEGESAEMMLEKLKSLAEDLDANPQNAQGEEEVEEEDVDDEFEEDDDDDYNAEKYFDDDGDDMGDDDNDEAAF